MKQFFLALLLFFGAGFAVARFTPFFKDKCENCPNNTIDLGFRPAPFTLDNQPFVVVIIGRNNGANVEPTLRSVFAQSYDNFRIVYIDDASTDGTFDFVRDLVYDSNHMGRVTLVKNEERLGKVNNLYRAIQTCADEEIVVLLGGEDRLSHEWVLQRLNQYYADPDLWLTYGQYREYPSLALGKSGPFLKEVGFRMNPFPASHFQTFYASLFKKIRSTDLFRAPDNDLAYMVPMLEMGAEHFQFIPEIHYLVSKMPPMLEESTPLPEQTTYEPLAKL